MNTTVSAEFDIARVNKIIGIVIHKSYRTLKSLNVDIEDLAGDLWLKAWRANMAWDSKKSANQYTFIQTACEREVVSKIREAARSEKHMPKVSLNVGIEENEDSLENLLNDPAADVLSVVNVTITVEKARRSLKATDRVLFEFLLDGMTQDEMARKLGCTQPSISMRLAALRNQLQWMKADLGH